VLVKKGAKISDLVFELRKTLHNRYLEQDENKTGAQSLELSPLPFLDLQPKVLPEPHTDTENKEDQSVSASIPTIPSHPQNQSSAIPPLSSHLYQISPDDSQVPPPPATSVKTQPPPHTVRFGPELVFFPKSSLVTILATFCFVNLKTSISEH